MGNLYGQKKRYFRLMRNIFVTLLILVPGLLGAQQKAFTISGRISGFQDGTKVSFYDRSTNKLDSMTVIRNNSFFIKGVHLEEPDFRFLVFNDRDPAIPVLMDNSDVTVSGNATDLNHLQFSGSALQQDYQKLARTLEKFETAFKNQKFTKEDVDQISDACESFANSNRNSYVSLLAVSQLFMTSKDPLRSEKVMRKLGSDVRNSNLGKQIEFQIKLQSASAIGTRIQPFTQKDINGKPVSISDFKGKYVLIDFWASWCGPCRMENPNVLTNYNRFKNKNFTILGVSLDQSRSAWKKAIDTDQLNWTQVSDLKGWQNEVSTMFHITSIPQNILIDPDGIIIAKNIRGAELGRTLEKILGK